MRSRSIALPAERPLELSLEESRVIARRRRGRNLGILLVLLALAALFYAITIVKMTKS